MTLKIPNVGVMPMTLGESKRLSEIMEAQERHHQMRLELGADLQAFEEEAVAFAAERERLGAYSADAAAIIELANRQVQLVQMLRRVAGLIL